MESIIDKIKKLEALIADTKMEGERTAAIEARKRLIDKKEYEEIEYTISTGDMWHKRLFMALCRKHSLKPYRYYRQKHTTVMVRVGKRFLDNVLWKEYTEMSNELRSLIDEVTTEIISKIHKDEEETIISGDLIHSVA